MSFHGNIAESAVRDGNTPEQFHAAAQRHANAFWIYAAIGAAVWYFFGLWWSLMPLSLAAFVAVQSVSSTLVAGKLEQSRVPPSVPRDFDLSDPADVDEIDEIREQYSAVLGDDSGPYSLCVYRPASTLPFPKPVIRKALMALLDFVEGRRDSEFIDGSLRRAEAADFIKAGLIALDDYLDIPAEQLPTERAANLLAGHRILSWKQQSGTRRV